MDRGTEQDYFPDQNKSLFISDNTEDEEEARGRFEQAGLNLIT